MPTEGACPLAPRPPAPRASSEPPTRRHTPHASVLSPLHCSDSLRARHAGLPLTFIDKLQLLRRLLGGGECIENTGAIDLIRKAHDVMGLQNVPGVPLPSKLDNLLLVFGVNVGQSAAPAPAASPAAAPAAAPAADTPPTAAASRPPASAAVPPRAPTPRAPTQASLFDYGRRQVIASTELREQRKRAAEGESYSPSIFVGVKRQTEATTRPPARRFKCRSCLRTFSNEGGRAAHEKTHVKGRRVDVMLAEPPQPPKPVALTLDISVDAGGRCGLELLVDSVALPDICRQRQAAAAAAAADEAAHAERAAARAVELKRRKRAREARDQAEAAEEGEQRRGSARRKQ